MISCVLLSAGNSVRFGSPKALARINDQMTILEFVQSTLLKTKVSEIIIVLGAYSSLIEPFILKHERIKSVYNKDYNLGQTSSFQTGLRNINPDAVGVMLLPVDCPFVKPTTIDLLVEEFLSEPLPSILIPSYREKKGHPPLFHTNLKSRILEIPENKGLNDFQHGFEGEISELPVSDPGILQSFNTLKEFEELKEINKSLLLG